MERIATLKVVKVVKVTQDAISIYFKQPFFNKIKYMPGQFLTLLMDIDGKIERRCYSLNSSPDLDKEVSITVKRIKDGTVSNYLYENIKEGTKMKVLYPMGSFTVKTDPKKERHIVLFGAGSGITPLMSILKSVLHVERKSYVSLFYGNRDEESIIFNQELQDLQVQYGDRLTLVHILENPGDFEDCYKGRVERSQVPELMKSVKRMSFGLTECYICGPSGMMIEAEEGLKLAGIPLENIHIERFTVAPPTAEEIKAEGAFLENREIKLLFKGKEYFVPVKASTTILDAVLDENIKVPYVCMDGICGTCKAECVSGEVFMRKGHVLSQAEVDANFVLPCICKPLTNNVVIKYS